MDHSIFAFVLQAGPVVKSVLFILLFASVFSWTLIIQRIRMFSVLKTMSQKFQQQFWSGAELNRLYQGLAKRKDNLEGPEKIFYAGFKEFLRLRQAGFANQHILDALARSMRITQAEEIDKLEQNLQILATIGSTSPYVGLFGTVWGIMTSFQALGQVQQATIAMVAPGISEALIATAIGLFAAIPAVIAYNRFANSIERVNSEYENFSENLYGILSQELYAPKLAKAQAQQQEQVQIQRG